MDTRQKKIITIAFQFLIFIISIGLMISGIVIGTINKEGQMGQWLAIAGSFLTPSTIIGVWIKYYMNKYHKKTMKSELEESFNELCKQNGLNNTILSTSKTQKQVSRVNIPKKAKLIYTSPKNWKVYLNGKELIFDFNDAHWDFQEDFYKQAMQCFGEVQEIIRKDLVK